MKEKHYYNFTEDENKTQKKVVTFPNQTLIQSVLSIMKVYPLLLKIKNNM